MTSPRPEWSLPAILLLALQASPAAAETASVEGSESQIKCQRVDDVLLLNVEQTAAAFGFRAKLSGQVLILCQLDDAGRETLCVPIRLPKRGQQGAADSLMIAADLLGQAMNFTVRQLNGQVRLRREPERTGEPPETYHAAWGENRGFQVGQTLPDIPLFDMEGREVRFSRFLGRRYILYCWASW